jgi:hypothetical protein
MAVDNTSSICILEMYRPRVKGKVDRPLYDSRLVGCWLSRKGLITRPRKHWITNSVSKVSRRGFIAFLKKSLGMVAAGSNWVP